MAARKSRSGERGHENSVLGYTARNFEVACGPTMLVHCDRADKAGDGRLLRDRISHVLRRQS
jgi:hypothetical protein